MSSERPRTPAEAEVLAAGALPWRCRKGHLEVALVHRPRYDDWSWPKGKLDPGERFPDAAVREVAEETGLRIRLGRPLPSAFYPLMHRSAATATKVVRYWAGEVIDGDGTLEHEIDEVAWLGPVPASDRLSHPRDREQLRALVGFAEDLSLASWPLIVVRHAKAARRSAWDGPDPRRPLTRQGRTRAAELVPLVAAYGITRVLSSPSIRCTETMRPYADAAQVDVRIRPGLSEEGHAARPGRARHHLLRLIERGEPAALCSHGPVLPDLLGELARLAEPGSAAANALSLGLRSGLGKGEALVVHLIGTGPAARVVDAERHLP